MASPDSLFFHGSLVRAVESIPAPQLEFHFRMSANLLLIHIDDNVKRPIPAAAHTILY
ncbi:uncharacterized protein LAESUDRAFT_719742 [Laetiporus sulphureus 93-53]|uniref:Uncharacterized protein n=1 Tax=Laetiporus sulphureus 93-53 TaxID=1314785 RepID=A0A165HJ97_9APHY|nr:uncharacterized protein LAESUDRAFT_719742 [Laetiporus sulphureus 93-53]KZT11799.1 hypothetical protein LAESUDRAFT_719742 [Laetiporus sulphureus 93-53]